jgi:hypothetical protein
VIRVCVAGVTGWTGSAVAAAVDAASDLELVAGVSRADPASYSTVAEALDAVSVDVLVDYTHAAAVRGNVLAAVERGVNVVVGSSGLAAADYEEIDALARARSVGVVAAGNFSTPISDHGADEVGRARTRRRVGHQTRYRSVAAAVEDHINRPPVSVALKFADNQACSPPDKSNLPRLSSRTRAPDLAPELGLAG